MISYWTNKKLRTQKIICNKKYIKLNKIRNNQENLKISGKANRKV